MSYALKNVFPSAVRQRASPHARCQCAAKCTKYVGVLHKAQSVQEGSIRYIARLLKAIRRRCTS